MPSTPDSQLERLTVKQVLSPLMRSIFLKSTTPMLEGAQHIIALGLYDKPAQAGRAIEAGRKTAEMEKCRRTSPRRPRRVWRWKRAGFCVVELVLQLRGKAGERQLSRAKIGLAQSWRGVPTTSRAVVILGVEPPRG